jgi:hypothetical protein
MQEESSQLDHPAGPSFSGEGILPEPLRSATLAVSVVGINDRSPRLPATNLILCPGQLSTSFRWAGSPLTMPAGAGLLQSAIRSGQATMQFDR